MLGKKGEHLTLSHNIISRLRIIRIALIKSRTGVFHEAFLITVVDDLTNFGADLVIERADPQTGNSSNIPSSARFGRKYRMCVPFMINHISAFIDFLDCLFLRISSTFSEDGGDIVSVRRALCRGIPPGYKIVAEDPMPARDDPKCVYFKQSLVIAQLVSESTPAYNLPKTKCYYCARQNYRMHSLLADLPLPMSTDLEGLPHIDTEDKNHVVMPVPIGAPKTDVVFKSYRKAWDKEVEDFEEKLSVCVLFERLNHLDLCPDDTSFLGKST